MIEMHELIKDYHYALMKTVEGEEALIIYMNVALQMTLLRKEKLGMHLITHILS